MTPSLQEGSHGFAECVAMRRQTSPVPARVRQSPNVYPFRTREPLRVRQQRQHYMLICRYFMSKPSDGLEPSTPSLPFLFRGGKRGRGRVIAGTKAPQAEGI